MRRIVVLLIMATVAGSIAYGAAASLNVGAANLGAGSGGVLPCDPNGVDVDYVFAVVGGETDYTEVTGLVLTDVAATCVGANLVAQVNPGAEGGATTGTLNPVAYALDDDGNPIVGEVRVAFAGDATVAAADVDEVAITIVGGTAVAP